MANKITDIAVRITGARERVVAAAAEIAEIERTGLAALGDIEVRPRSPR